MFEDGSSREVGEDGGCQKLENGWWVFRSAWVEWIIGGRCWMLETIEMELLLGKRLY